MKGFWLRQDGTDEIIGGKRGQATLLCANHAIRQSIWRDREIDGEIDRKTSKNVKDVTTRRALVESNGGRRMSINCSQEAQKTLELKLFSFSYYYNISS